LVKMLTKRLPPEARQIEVKFKRMTDKQHINVLLIEDNRHHADLISSMLMHAKDVHIQLQHAERLSSAFERLAGEPFDVVLFDLGLPDSQGIETFIKVHDRYPNIPIIVQTALNDIQLALRAVQEGAQDYLVKGQFDDGLLVRAMQYSIERKKLATKLEKSLNEIKTLRGLLPICAWCKNIRDDKGYWKRVEAYIEEHTQATFTHGICPDCRRKVASPSFLKEIEKDHPGMFEGNDDETKTTK